MNDTTRVTTPESDDGGSRGYPGSKAGSGTYQFLINHMPPHSVYVEPFLGMGAIMRKKRPAAEKEKKRAARYKECSLCHKQVRREKWDSESQVCDKCYPVYLELVESRRQRQLERMLARDRAAAIAWAKDILAAGVPTRIIDTETTGLGHQAEIVQVAIIDLAGDVLYQTLVHPMDLIPEDATMIHGITNEMVADAPDFPAVYERLREELTGKRVVAYNASFDHGMMLQTAERYEDRLPDLIVDRWECAMEAYATFCGNWNSHYGSYTWLPLPGAGHSAAADCLATLKVIQEMAAAELVDPEKVK